MASDGAGHDGCASGFDDPYDAAGEVALQAVSTITMAAAAETACTPKRLTTGVYPRGNRIRKRC
jgi:hypothetical protein